MIMITIIGITSNKSPRIHGKVTVKLKRLPPAILLWPENQHAEWYVDGRNIIPANQFPEKMVSHIDVLGVGVGYRVLRKLHWTLIILEHWYAWRPNIRQHKTPNLPQKQHLLKDVCKCHVLGLRCRKCYAFLSPWKPRQTGTTTHH